MPKERGIEAIKVRHYPGSRRAHNEQIFNRHKAVLDAMGDQAPISASVEPWGERRKKMACEIWKMRLG
jgi:hypothetical protein